MAAWSACHHTPAARLQARDQIVNPLVRQRADPMVLKAADGTYYLTATVPEYDRIELRAAPSIGALGVARPVTIWRKHATGEMGAHIWAPELHRIYGKWYIYFAAGRADSVWKIRMYVLENASLDPLKGEWVEKGQIRTGVESFSLDATTFAYHGKRYLAWAQQDTSLKNNSSIFIAEMSNPWTITGTPVRLSKPELPWETIGFRVNEGPAVLVKGGHVFLTYSASATDANYAMGMLTASWIPACAGMTTTVPLPHWWARWMLTTCGRLLDRVDERCHAPSSVGLHHGEGVDAAVRPLVADVEVVWHPHLCDTILYVRGGVEASLRECRRTRARRVWSPRAEGHPLHAVAEPNSSHDC